MVDYLQYHWLALGLTVIGLTLVLLRRGTLIGPASLFLGAGGLTPHSANAWGLDIAMVSGGVLAVMLVVVVASGMWSVSLAYLAAAGLLFGLGLWLLAPLADSIIEVVRFLLSLGVDRANYGWLLGLLLVPLMIWISYGRLVGLGPVRSRIALGLRCLLIIFICLALAETHARQVDRNTTVLFVLDRSQSIPTELVGDEDVRLDRILKFISQAVDRRGSARDGDRTGVIVFGRFPRLELPPASISQLPVKNLRDIVRQSVIDGNYTDIGTALKLALASFPEGSSKRIVLVSDGNENLGNAVDQARLAKHNGVPIDVVPIAAGRHSANEVMVERVEAPPYNDKTTKIPLRVVMRSFHPGLVAGELQLIRHSLEKQKGDEGKESYQFDIKTVLVERIKLQQGLNVRFYQQPGMKADEAVTYEAKFTPLHVETAEGRFVHAGLPGDRLDNNRASTTVVTGGRRAILLVESTTASPKTGDHSLLAERLGQGGGLNVVTIRSDALPTEPTKLAMVLSKFDCVILGNVPADEITDVQQSVIRSNTHEQGAGLIVIGGPESFGAGGWQDSELEKAFPVTCDNKSTKIDVRGGLVLIMHASEMADGNSWQKKIAKLAIEKLAPVDMMGMIYYAGIHDWHIPFRTVGGNRAQLFRRVDMMIPGDMPDFEPALRMAHNELIRPEHQLGTKHIIFISDGDPTFPGDAYLAKVGRDNVTLTTVCITSHGAQVVSRMKGIAQKVVTRSGKTGRDYHVTDPRDLPRIYMKETRIVSQSYVYQSEFQPRLVRREDPVANLRGLPPLHGFVRTTRRPTNLVEVPIETPKIGTDEFPILATWNYGLGRTVAFTSDARSGPESQFWDRDWAGAANSTMYTQFWKQVVDWARRPDDRGKFLSVTTDLRKGRIRVIVEALDKNNLPIPNVEIQPGATALSIQQKEARKVDLKFEQTSAGIYEADFQAEEVGSYFVNIKGSYRDKEGKIQSESVRIGVTIPYSPEYGEMESRPDLLHKLADMTGGKVYEESEDALTRVAGELYQPVLTNQRSLQPLWYLLVLVTGVGMFLDVAVRRISIETEVVTRKLRNLWASVRGQQTEQTPLDPFIERLKSRKVQVDETLAKEISSRRFEGPPPPEQFDVGVPGPKDAPPPPKAPPTPSVAPEKPAAGDSYADRLMRAKKRAQDDRDKK